MRKLSSIQMAGIVLAILIVAIVGVYVLTDTSSKDDTMVLVDYAGRSVTLTDPATVASGYPISTEVMLFIGGESKIIGADSNCISNAFMNSMYPSLAAMENLGNPWNLNVEQIVALDPDVFIMGGTSTDMADQLTALGVPTLCLSFETPDDFSYALEILGIVLDKEKNADEAIDYYEQQVEEIREKTSDLKSNEKPDVLFLSFGARGITDFQTPGAGMLQNNLLTLAGGHSVSETQPGGWNAINMDQIAVWDPDIIIVTSYSSSVTSLDLKAQILSDSTWNVTSAKTEGNVYAFAQDWGSWDAPTPKWILGLTWMSAHMHPDLYEASYVENMATEFYGMFYDLTYEEAGVAGD